MNKEIKEIFEYFKKFMSAKDCAKVIMIENFITNLQEIEKDHKRINGELREQLKQTEQLAMEYKTRNEKTINILNDVKEKPEEYVCGWCYPFIEEYFMELLNILQGSDKE